MRLRPSHYDGPIVPILDVFALIFSYLEFIVGLMRIKLSLLFDAPTTFMWNALVVMPGRE